MDEKDRLIQQEQLRIAILHAVRVEEAFKLMSYRVYTTDQFIEIIQTLNSDYVAQSE